MDLSYSPNFICFIPNVTYCPNFELSSLITSLKFSHSFNSGRKAVLFGQHSYAYGNTFHSPCSFSTNCYISELFNFAVEVFPSLNLNSCLINYYSDSSKCMPDHTDDERYIELNSFIVTLSLGAPRSMVIKDAKAVNHCLLSNFRMVNFFYFLKIASVDLHTVYLLARCLVVGPAFRPLLDDLKQMCSFFVFVCFVFFGGSAMHCLPIYSLLYRPTGDLH